MEKENVKKDQMSIDLHYKNGLSNIIDQNSLISLVYMNEKNDNKRLKYFSFPKIKKQKLNQPM